MRVNYKFLFNYLDDRLDASQTHELMLMLKEEPRVVEMLDRLRGVLNNPVFQQPHGKEGNWPNANLVSAYLEGTLKGDDLKTVEDVLESDDHFLAHLATCHKVISGLIPIPVPSRTLSRSYELGKEVGAIQKMPAKPKAIPREKLEDQVPTQAISKNTMILIISGPMLMILLGLLLLKTSKPPEKPVTHTEIKAGTPSVEQNKNEFAKLPEKKDPIKTDPVISNKKNEVMVPQVKGANPITKETTIIPKMISKANLETRVEAASLQEVNRENILLMHKQASNQPYTRMINPVHLETSLIYLCLPGSMLSAEPNKNLQINFVGETRSTNPEPMYSSCEFRFYSNETKVVDISLKNGRAVIKSKNPQRMILRSWDFKIALEIELKDDSEIVMEAAADKLHFGISHGSCIIHQDGKEKPMPELPAGGMVFINSLGEIKRQTAGEKNPIFSSQPIPLEFISNDKALGAALSELSLALKPNLDVTQAILGYIFANNSNDARRNIGCLALGAMGEAKKLLELWGTDSPQQTLLRLYALKGLRLWLMMEPAEAGRLYIQDSMDGWLPRAGYTPEQSLVIKKLLTEMPAQAGKKDYEELLGLLTHENARIRELSYLQLRQYARTTKDIPDFLSLAQPASRSVEVSKWRELLENGQLPIKQD